MARIIVGATGSVAAIRTPALVTALRTAGHDARVAATEHALYFFDPSGLPEPDEDAGPPLGRAALFRDVDEWPGKAPSSKLQAPSEGAIATWSVERGAWSPGEAAWGVYRRDDPVLHIELRRWADLLVIAPLDANTLAKLAMGLTDNLLTSLYRAWDPQRPVVLAPAMNTFMWDHPLTRRHLELLLGTFDDRPRIPIRPRNATDDRLSIDPSPEAVIDAINERCLRLRVCAPQSKRLACGDEGMGAMADVDAIVAAVAEMLAVVGDGASRLGK